MNNPLGVSLVKGIRELHEVKKKYFDRRDFARAYINERGVLRLNWKVLYGVLCLYGHWTSCQLNYMIAVSTACFCCCCCFFFLQYLCAW